MYTVFGIYPDKEHKDALLKLEQSLFNMCLEQDKTGRMTVS